jgi:hypothetical protein
MRIRILSTHGIRDADVPAASDRSTIGSHWNAVQTFLYTGETEELERYRGDRVAGLRLMTNSDEIERLARIGELDLEDIYES